MAHVNQVFERKEVKYHLDPEQFLHLQESLAGHMRPDDYGRTLISSMYWDTSERSLIGRSVEKPLYKEKIRVRRYGAPIVLDDAPCFLEVKKKYKGIVYKRRVKMSGKAVDMFLRGGNYEDACHAFPLPGDSSTSSLPVRDRQIGAEIAQFRDFHGPLFPSMTIECMRTAWELLPNSPDAWTQLRITFDEELSYQDLMAPAAGSDACPHVALIPSGDVVLEIKAVGAMPRWLVDALNASNIRPGSFTKYGRAYEVAMKLKKAS